MITYKKRSDNHIFSHIYEHAFFIILNNTFRAANMMPIIDYEIDAYTENAEITISIEIYNNKIDADSFMRAAERLDIKVSLEIAVAQVEVEYGHQIITDKNDLSTSMERFHKLQWSNQDLPYVTRCDITEGCRLLGVHKLSLTIEYPELGNEDFALFRIVAGACLNAICSDLVDQRAGFIDSEVFYENTLGNLEMRVLLHPTVDINGIVQLIESLKEKILSSIAYKRLIDSLLHVEDMDKPPSNHVVDKGRVIEMNMDRWKAVATLPTLQRLSGLINIRLTNL